MGINEATYSSMLVLRGCSSYILNFIVYVKFYFAFFIIVLISPLEITAYSGGSATYLCITSSSINTETVRGVQWFIGGVQVNNLQYGTKEEFFPNNGNSGQLLFTNITLDLDMSRISCAAEFESGSNESSNTQSLLRVQGEAYNYAIVQLRFFSGPYNLLEEYAASILFTP